jgi:hypothetical protein
MPALVLEIEARSAGPGDIRSLLPRAGGYYFPLRKATPLRLPLETIDQHRRRPSEGVDSAYDEDLDNRGTAFFLAYPHSNEVSERRLSDHDGIRLLPSWMRMSPIGETKGLPSAAVDFALGGDPPRGRAPR